MFVDLQGSDRHTAFWTLLHERHSILISTQSLEQSICQSTTLCILAPISSWTQDGRKRELAETRPLGSSVPRNFRIAGHTARTVLRLVILSSLSSEASTSFGVPE